MENPSRLSVAHGTLDLGQEERTTPWVTERLSDSPRFPTLDFRVTRFTVTKLTEMESLLCSKFFRPKLGLSVRSPFPNSGTQMSFAHSWKVSEMTSAFSTCIHGVITNLNGMLVSCDQCARDRYYATPEGKAEIAERVRIRRETYRRNVEIRRAIRKGK